MGVSDDPVIVGLIIGSVREGRRAMEVAEWAASIVGARVDIELHVLDLKHFELPMMTAATNPMRAGRVYADDVVRAWSRAVDECEAFILLTPEYNHGVPGALKNAVDHLGPEWVGKAVGFISWGSAGGIRAVEQWRVILANFTMFDVRQQVVLLLPHELDNGVLAPNERREVDLARLLDDLVDTVVRLGRHPLR